MKYYIATLLLVTSTLSAHAAKVLLDVSKNPSGTAYILHVSLDTEGVSANAVSGVISFPSDLLKVKSLDTTSSIISLWGTQPTETKERSFNVRTQITFEGIMPGGFVGVRSPYYQGERPGKILDIELTPIGNGEAYIMFDSVRVLANDGKASSLSVTAESVTIPTVMTKTSLFKDVAIKKISTGVFAPFITHDQNVARGKWYLVPLFTSNQKTVKELEVAETRTSDPESIAMYEWSTVSGTYVLAYQNRNRFVHVKASYYDDTYEIVTLAPVENSQDNLLGSYILIGIIMLIAWTIIRTLHARYSSHKKRSR